MATGYAFRCLVSLAIGVLVSSYDYVDPFKSLLIIPHCGNSTANDAWLQIKSDLAISGDVVCKLNERFAFETNSTTEFYIPLYFDGSTLGRCVFAKKKMANMYTIQVDVLWRERGGEIETLEKTYQVTCIFCHRGRDESPSHGIVEPLNSSREIQMRERNQSASEIKDGLSAIGDESPSSVIHVGRMVLLQAQDNGAGNELGVCPVVCELLDTMTGEKYSILKAGCGDGLVLKKDQGFKPNGLLSLSLPFKMLSVGKDVSVKFQCNFSLCPNNCNGESCKLRKKQSVSGDEGLTPTINTNSVNAILIKGDFVNISGITVDLNREFEYHLTAKSPSTDDLCIDCQHQLSSPDEYSRETDFWDNVDELPPADILPNVNMMKREYQRWSKQLSFGSFALMIQSAWPLGLAVLMAIGMFTTLVVAMLLVWHHSKAGSRPNGFSEYESLLK